MLIGHYDVDNSIRKYLKDDIFEVTFHEITSVVPYDCITIKSASRITNKIITKQKNIKLIVTRTVGTDHIDLDLCKKNKIAVYHIVDYGSFNIAEHALALLLTGTRNTAVCQEEIKKGIFSYKNWLGFSLQGKALGVIGTGRIGLELIKRANALGMMIIAYDIYKNEKAAIDLNFKYVPLDELLTKSDVISLHAPLMPETRHMINSQAIAKMKDGVILINTARGELINTIDLVDNIAKFKFVGLDVLENEAGFSIDNPLLDYKNILITPHVSFFTDASVKKIAMETYTCIENYINNVKAGCVV